MRKIKGIYHIELGPNRLVPLKTEGGMPIGEPGTIGDGWEPQFVYAGFAPVYVLEWQHENGGRGTWYLNSELRAIGGTHRDPPPEALAVIREKGAQTLKSAWRSLICETAARLGGATESFFRIGLETRMRIFELCKGDLALPADCTDLRSTGAETFIVDPDHHSPAFPRSGLISVLQQPMPRLAGEAIERGSVSWPSPLTGERLATSKAICLNERLFLYRLGDGDLVFYVVVIYEGFTTPLMVYFPGSNRCFGFGKPTETIIRLHGNSLEELLWKHLAIFGKDLNNYFKINKSNFFVLFYQSHVGHHLWNELTEVDRLLHLCDMPNLPQIMLVGNANREIYGPVDEIFPEVAGRVERRVSVERLPEILYSRNYCALGGNRSRISRELAKRVLHLNLRRPELADEVARTASGSADRARPVVLFGLRFENRTAINLAELYIGVAQYLLAKAGPLAIVLDGGLNPGYGSTAQRIAESKSNILSRMRSGLAVPGIDLIDIVDAPLARSLFWGARSDFWISIWGAGLALYHWICDRPGIAITSKWNLSNHGELGVYSKNRERPNQIEFLPAEFVEDAPDAPLLVNNLTHRSGTLMNFLVHTEGLYSLLDRFLTEYSPRK